MFSLIGLIINAYYEFVVNKNVLTLAKELLLFPNRVTTLLVGLKLS